MQITILSSGGLRTRSVPIDQAAAKRAGVATSDIVAAVKPIQHSRAMTMLEALPVVVHSDNGKELDRAVLTVSARTGMLKLVRLTGEVVSQVDEEHEEPAEPAAQVKK